MTKQRTLFPTDSLADLTAVPGNDAARQMTERSAQKCLELSKTLNQSDLLRKMSSSLLTFEWDSKKRFLIWKLKITKSNLLLFQLRPSAQTNALLPTPSARMLGSTPKTMIRKSGRSRLNDRLDYNIERGGRNGRLNPEFVEWMMGFPPGWTEEQEL